VLLFAFLDNVATESSSVLRSREGQEGHTSMRRFRSVEVDSLIPPWFELILAFFQMAWIGQPENGKSRLNAIFVETDLRISRSGCRRRECHVQTAPVISAAAHSSVPVPCARGVKLSSKESGDRPQRPEICGVRR